MGLFGRQRDPETAMRQADAVASGRGLAGKLARGFMGAENARHLQDGLTAARMPQVAARAVAAGLPTVVATVASVADTGQVVNADPVILVVVTLPDGSSVPVRTLVSKLQVPRPGDTVLLVENPAQPGALAYAGPAA